MTRRNGRIEWAVYALIGACKPHRSGVYQIRSEAERAARALSSLLPTGKFVVVPNEDYEL